MTRTPPVFLCTRVGNGDYWKFWCPFCLKYHHHGGEARDGEVGHRAAHCINPNSPLRDTGYILRAVVDGA
jgi:hypothetical protein